MAPRPSRSPSKANRRASGSRRSPSNAAAGASGSGSRDNFYAKAVRDLAVDAGHACSLCRRPTSGPSAERGKRSNAGTAAHITAASRRGPRFDPSLTTHQRRSPENGLWCCRNCGKLVDDDASTFTVEFLRIAKSLAVERARRAVLTGDPDPDGYRRQAHASRHRVATDVALGVDRIRWLLPGAADAWHNWRRTPEPKESATLITALDQFGNAIVAIKEARDQVRVLWGEQIAAPLQTFGDSCSILRSMILMDLTGQLPKSITDREYAESRDGGRRREELEEFARLIEDWAAPYLGRADAIELTEDELAARSWRISGIPEDQVQEIVGANAIARDARRAGHSRKAVRALVHQWHEARRATRSLTLEPLEAGGANGKAIVSELERALSEAVARGETSPRVRLPAQLDAALEIAMMKNAGAVVTILGDQFTRLAKRHPSLKQVQLAVGRLPEAGWSFGNHSR